MRVLIPLLLAAMACVAQAEVYKWVDADGKVHYGDKPKHQAESVNLKPPPPKYGVQEEAPVDGGQAAGGGSAEECNRKREQLAEYINATKLFQVDALGERTELSAEDRSAVIERTRSQMQAACQGAEAADAGG